MQTISYKDIYETLESAYGSYDMIKTTPRVDRARRLVASQKLNSLSGLGNDAYKHALTKLGGIGAMISTCLMSEHFTDKIVGVKDGHEECLATVDFSVV